MPLVHLVLALSKLHALPTTTTHPSLQVPLQSALADTCVATMTLPVKDVKTNADCGSLTVVSLRDLLSCRVKREAVILLHILMHARSFSLCACILAMCSSALNEIGLPAALQTGMTPASMLTCCIVQNLSLTPVHCVSPTQLSQLPYSYSPKATGACTKICLPVFSAGFNHHNLHSATMECSKQDESRWKSGGSLCKATCLFWWISILIAPRGRENK
mgnify:CR=1 FL=1